MKKGLFLTLLALLLLVVVSVASAELADEIDVTQYGAVSGDGADDSKAINQALEDAGRRATDDHKITVVIPEGSWNLSDSLKVFSNITLKADDKAYFHSSIKSGPMIQEAHFPAAGGVCSGGCTHSEGYGYNKAKNVTISGGTWTACESVTDEALIISIHHSQNIRIQNLTCRKFTNNGISLGGVDNGTISHVIFENQLPFSKKTSHEELFTMECVHLDYCTEEGEYWYGSPYDNTASKNITVTDCTFNNVYTGVGNHMTVPSGGSASSNIMVNNNEFRNVICYATSINGVQGMKVNNNKLFDSPVLAFLHSANDLSIQGNTVDGGNKDYSYFDGQSDSVCTNIYLSNAGKVTVSKNTINNYKYNAIRIQFPASAQSESEISDNEINNVAREGMDIRSKGNNKVTISGNKLSDIGKEGITIGSLVGAVVSGNTVDSSAATALHIIGSDGATASLTATDNILSCSNAGQGENYDVFVNKYTDCTFTGNTLKNRCFHCSKGAKFTADFPKLKTIVMDEFYVYTGEKIEPEIQVEDDTGMVLTEGVDYKVEYKHNLRVGDSQAKVKVKGISFTMFDSQVIEKKLVIIPWKIKKLSVKAGKKQITVKWKLDKKNDYEGYEIEYALKKSFKDAKSITVKNIKDTETVIKKLKKGKTYYVRGRVWKESGGKKYYSEWSDTLKVKVK